MPDAGEARDYLHNAASLDLGALRDVYQSMMADGYAAGRMTAGVQLEAVVDYGNDWAAWEPGDAVAAEMLEDGGFAALLEEADIVLQGIGDSMLDRMGTALAEGAGRGASVDEIAADLEGILGDANRAYTIANTELARAMTAASLQSYGEAGVTAWDWILSPGACQACQSMKSNNPHSLGDTAPPLHPHCRCATAPLESSMTG